MCFQFPVGEMNIETWEQAAGIYADSRKQGKPVEDTDILIAAFCIVHGYTLVTDNTRHFENIKGLQFVNWSE